MKERKSSFFINLVQCEIEDIVNLMNDLNDIFEKIKVSVDKRTKFSRFMIPLVIAKTFF